MLGIICPLHFITATKGLTILQCLPRFLFKEMLESASCVIDHGLLLRTEAEQDTVPVLGKFLGYWQDPKHTKHTKAAWEGHCIL